jgi:hypothetical protein
VSERVAVELLSVIMAAAAGQAAERLMRHSCAASLYCVKLQKIFRSQVAEKRRSIGVASGCRWLHP